MPELALFEIPYCFGTCTSLVICTLPLDSSIAATLYQVLPGTLSREKEVVRRVLRLAPAPCSLLAVVQDRNQHAGLSSMI